jgi:signal transduction histidine kinase
VFQVILSALAIGRASTPLPFADAFRLNATVPLDNAATHSTKGAAIWLSASRDGPHAVLAVRDQGPGIPPDQRDRVFERYTRGDQPTGSPGSGLGLGLYIAKRLARANRGQLHLTDPPGRRGARFELRLPLAPPAPGGPSRIWTTG